MATGSSTSPLAHYCGKLLESANSQYLDNMCEMLYKECDINSEVYFPGNVHFDWLSSSTRLQVISQPTRVVTNGTGIKSSTCIDHIFTNAAEVCFKAVSKSIGFSDHSIIAISRKPNFKRLGLI